jgi:glycosyltransferase involved in cell wall biosynthesis
MKLMIVDGNVDLIAELAHHRGIEVSVLANRKKLARLEQARADIRPYFYYARSKVHWPAISLVRQAIREVRPDIIHAFRTYPLSNTLLSTTFLKSPARIVSFRGIMQPPSRWDPGNWISYLHPRVTAHACASDAVRRGMVAGGVDSSRCFVTYECVRPGSWDRPGRDALAPWDVPREAFVVGTVATIRPVKGIDILLQAARLCADHKDIYWVLIGPVYDPQVEQLASHPSIASRVRLLGHRPDAPELISGADVFVMPSRMEGLCRALLEAMSQGVCPVVSDAGGCKEIVRPGQDGIVFPSEDVHALAAAIQTLYADRDQVAVYAQSARERIASEFSPQKMSQRSLALYHHVLAN